MKVKLLNKCNKSILEDRIRIIASAAKLSRFPGSVFEVLNDSKDYESNLKVVNRVLNMGHESIIDHDYFVFALSDVSGIIEQTIISYRFTSFTIKSGRMVDFRNVGFYVPEFRNLEGRPHPKNKELKKKYKIHMKELFKEYEYYVDNNINVEDARFIIPFAFYTNIIMGLDAHELYKMLIEFIHGKRSKIAEIKELGEKLLDIAKIKIPYLYERVLNYKEESFSNPDKSNIQRDTIIKFIEEPKLLTYNKNTDEEILLTYFMWTYQCDRVTARIMLEDGCKQDKNFKKNLMKYIITKKENRELEYVNFQFQVSFSLIVFKHMIRQRMQSLLIPDYVPLWNLENYFIPPSINNFDSKRFHKYQRKNIEMFNTFKKENVMPEDLIYFYLCSQSITIITNINGKSLYTMARVRACNKAQWQYRDIMKSMIKQVEKIAPIYGSLIGPSCKITGICPEGKESCRNNYMVGQTIKSK